MKFKEFCDLFFSKEKTNLFILSNEEISFLSKDTDTTNIEFSYETLDEHLADYILCKGSDFFDQNDDFYTAENYLENVREKLGKDFEFVTRTIKSVKSKLITYSLILTTSIKNSESGINSLSSRIIRHSQNTLKNIQRSEINLNKAQSSLDEAHKNIEDMIPNVLTVVSILISVIIAVVIIYITFFIDPSNLIDKILPNIMQVYMGKFVLSGHILGNVLFLLFFMLAIITNRSILTSCNDQILLPTFDPYGKDRYSPESFRNSCRNCTQKCSAKHRFIKRAAYIIYFNIFMVAIYTFLYIWWITEQYWNHPKEFIHSSDVVVVAILLLILLINLVYQLIKRSKNKIKKAKRKKADENANNTVDETEDEKIKIKNINCFINKISK